MGLGTKSWPNIVAPSTNLGSSFLRLARTESGNSQSTIAPKLEVIGVWCFLPSKNSRADLLVPCTPTYVLDMCAMYMTHSCSACPDVAISKPADSRMSVLKTTKVSFKFLIDLSARPLVSGFWGPALTTFTAFGNWLSSNTAPTARSSSVNTCRTPWGSPPKQPSSCNHKVKFLWFTSEFGPVTSTKLQSYVTKAQQQLGTFSLQERKNLHEVLWQNHAPHLFVFDDADQQF